MNEARKGFNDYKAQIVTAVIGLVVTLLTTYVPGLEPMRDALTEILVLLAALIVGQSIQKR